MKVTYLYTTRATVGNLWFIPQKWQPKDIAFVKSGFKYFKRLTCKAWNRSNMETGGLGGTGWDKASWYTPSSSPSSVVCFRQGTCDPLLVMVVASLWNKKNIYEFNVYISVHSHENYSFGNNKIKKEHYAFIKV